LNRTQLFLRLEVDIEKFINCPLNASRIFLLECRLLIIGLVMYLKLNLTKLESLKNRNSLTPAHIFKSFLFILMPTDKLGDALGMLIIQITTLGTGTDSLFLVGS